jgi:hypothetical protein
MKCPFCGLNKKKLVDEYNWREHIYAEVARRKPQRTAEILLKLLAGVEVLGLDFDDLSKMRPVEIPFKMLARFPEGIQVTKDGNWHPIKRVRWSGERR